MRGTVHGTKGMSLVEAIILIGIYTVLILVISKSIADLYRTNGYTFAQANEVESARRGIIKMSNDMREMITAEDGTYPLAMIGDNQIAFYSDTDNDGSVEYIKYELSSTTLKKYYYKATGTPPTYNLSGAPDQEDTVSTYVQNIKQGTSTFLYFDTNGAQLSTTSPILDVRYIKAQLIVNIDPVRSPGEFMLRTSVAPRNLKDNL